MAWRRKLKKSWILGVCKLMSLAIWWTTWKERNCWIFVGKARAYCLIEILSFTFENLYTRGQVLYNGTKITYLHFVDMIIVESLRACSYFVIPPFVPEGHPLGVSWIWISWFHQTIAKLRNHLGNTRREFPTSPYTLFSLMFHCALRWHNCIAFISVCTNQCNTVLWFNI